MGRLDGRVAFVTGAGRGIGAATALRMAEEGARVALVDIDVEGCQQVAQELERLGAQCLVLPCNVSNNTMVEEAVEKTVSQFGRLDILVNNAGIIRDNLLFKMSEEDWDAVMAVHLKGAFLCSRAAQKHMVQQRYGRIISLSSTSALGNRGQANYSTAKAGLQGFTRTLAIELGPFGITTNAVAPGFIDTEMTRSSARRQGLDPEEVIAEASKRIPVRRVGQPRDVANVICFLASEEAGFVNGQIIYVSGGPAPRS
ncbi:MAG: beta-ketoacyl-ACP reductase [Thermogemmatispora sp.]|jgi:3-oxoacyl-[acyl-carrier protein] reductase|uniref:Beta-ketoacyl-ACP reductase n=2 Tax=Thermogemmatispora TaxID=768669 RepID=A0A328VHV7_9CHLR|nr:MULTISPECIES: beta-ketoacyl-ACP reductase [Thermogemmatispora]MBE3567105.1 beta-ketoacyl-ACP reductase [Thermogemmatispora sp.]MBX5457285.1 beta-ketoacyl-ACP reductase [Thermogemmatispora sp.]RAQ97017.1 beta-ketoacyl-ACP reductase [Thermogemmatispora tikiterensis]GER84958.1 3-oxoacyl-ACP reductase [Thermogemmatispora aurantia]